MTVPLYVEARIRAGMDQLWEATQDPAQHRRWDLRFTHIDYLDSGAGGAQRFRYGVRVLGVMLSGTGVCAGERRGPHGTAVAHETFPHHQPEMREPFQPRALRAHRADAFFLEESLNSLQSPSQLG